MKFSPIVLLLFAMLGCDSGTPKVVPNSPQAKAAIEAEIREDVGKPTGELTKADFENVTWLKLNGQQITDLTPLADLTKLEELDLSHNQIADLTPLAGLTKLEELYLTHNQITNLTPLAGLKGLKLLRLSNNPDLNMVEIGKLQKALPKCKIGHDAAK